MRIDSPSKAIEQGIGMVHQHFMLVPVMTVAENIVLGAERAAAGCSTWRGDREVRELSERYRFAVDPDAVIEDVTVGTQQRVEILKTLYRGARILVLDEPTAVLTAQEASELFEVLRAEGGRRGDRVHQPQARRGARDRRSRDGAATGRKIDTVPTEGATEQSLARLMVGRDVLAQVDKPEVKPGEPVLEVEDLRVLDDRGLEAVRGVSLEVRAGEVVALSRAWTATASRSWWAIAGLRAPVAGRIVAGRTSPDVAFAPPATPGGPHRRGPPAARAGARLHAGREPGAARVPAPPLSRNGWLSVGTMRSRANELLAEYDVRSRDAELTIVALGRQPAEGLRRARDRLQPALLIAHQPTRGLDVGAIEFVHRRLVAERDRGRGILLVSLEFEEVRSLADRILVIYEGELVGEFRPMRPKRSSGSP